MNCNDMKKHEGHCSHHGGKGSSSFWMHDPQTVFAELDLEPDSCFLDIGCGPGDYSLNASAYISGSGEIWALDSNPRAISSLEEEISARKIDNIRSITADAGEPLPIADGSIDVCFISTALHAMDLPSIGEGLFREIRRVLKKKGRLSVIECQKKETGFGPPLSSRISPEELESYLAPFGFEKTGQTDLGDNYLIQFGISSRRDDRLRAEDIPV